MCPKFLFGHGCFMELNLLFELFFVNYFQLHHRFPYTIPMGFQGQWQLRLHFYPIYLLAKSLEVHRECVTKMLYQQAYLLVYQKFQ